MPLHARYSDGRRDTSRVLIRFERADYLWRSPTPLASPHTGEVVDELPIPVLPADEEGRPIEGAEPLRHVGPTILDMLCREVLRMGDLTVTQIEEGGLKPPPPDEKERKRWARQPVALWTIRDPATLWPTDPENRRKSAAREIEDMDVEREINHPFYTSLASGGVETGTEIRDDDGTVEFIEVTKVSSVKLAAHVYRLAAGMAGGIPAAYNRVGALAAAAWQRDLERAVGLWRLVRAAGTLVETPEIANRYRPTTSISQEVEAAIMGETCIWLGVDPNADVSRPAGRRATARTPSAAPPSRSRWRR